MRKILLSALLVTMSLPLGCRNAPEATPSESESIAPLPVVDPVYGPSNPTPEETARMEVKRVGSVIGLRPELEDRYRRLHADVWPEVLERLRQSGIRNYSIYITEIEGKRYLFSYYEYVGTNFEEDMRAIGEDPRTREWWRETDPCQIRLPGRRDGDNWSVMERLFVME